MERKAAPRQLVACKWTKYLRTRRKACLYPRDRHGTYHNATRHFDIHGNDYSASNPLPLSKTPLGL